jgi:hypothetical protein
MMKTRCQPTKRQQNVDDHDPRKIGTQRLAGYGVAHKGCGVVKKWCDVAHLECGVAQRVRRGSLRCGVAQQGAAWLIRVQRGSDHSAWACCMTGPSSNPGSAPQREALRRSREVLDEYRSIFKYCMYAGA